jgi:hypothetical protein
MNYSQTDAVVSDATLKAYADFVAYGDFKASIRGLLAAGANPNALQIAEIMGQQYSREERFNQIGDLAEAEGLEFNDREGTPTPRWDVSQGGYARPEPGGRVTPVEQMRPSMPTDLVDPARPQPNVKLPGNVSTILGMPQQQKVDIKTPYIEQIGQQTFESQRLIPQRVPSDIGVAANLTSAPAAAPTTKPASPYTPSSGPRRV